MLSTPWSPAGASAPADPGPRRPATPRRSRPARALARLLLRFVVRTVVMLFLVATVTFLAVHALPGNPVDVWVQDMQGTGLTAAQAADLATQLLNIDIDEPLWHQYLEYMRNLAMGDLGRSVILSPGTPVTEMLGERLLWTLFSVGLSLAVAFFIGLYLGSVAAYRRGTRIDRLITNGSAIMDSIPQVLVGIVLTFLLGVVWGIVPIQALRGAYSPDVQPGWNLPFILSALAHVFFPALVYVATSVGGWALVMRGSAISVLKDDYVTQARARGLAERTIRVSYVMRNAQLPLVTGFAISMGFVALRLDPRRVGVRLSRHRAATRECARPPRLHGDAGRGHRHDRDRAPGDRRRRRAVRLARSEDPSGAGLMSAEPVVAGGARRGGSRRFLAESVRRLGVGGTIGACGLIVIVVASAIGWFLTKTPATDLDAIIQGPSLAHPLGTDYTGSDNLHLVLRGGWDMLELAVVAGLLMSAIAVAVGLLGAFSGGIVDRIVVLADGRLARDAPPRAAARHREPLPRGFHVRAGRADRRLRVAIPGPADPRPGAVAAPTRVRRGGSAPAAADGAHPGALPRAGDRAVRRDLDHPGHDSGHLPAGRAGVLRPGAARGQLGRAVQRRLRAERHLPAGRRLEHVRSGRRHLPPPVLPRPDVAQSLEASSIRG